MIMPLLKVIGIGNIFSLFELTLRKMIIIYNTLSIKMTRMSPLQMLKGPSWTLSISRITLPETYYRGRWHHKVHLFLFNCLSPIVSFWVFIPTGREDDLSWQPTTQPTSLSLDKNIGVHTWKIKFAFLYDYEWCTSSYLDDFLFRLI